MTSAIEHSSVQEPLRELQRRGCTLMELPCDADGHVRAEQILEALDSRTFLISIHLANNEIGTIQDLKKISDVCKKKNVLFHSDACQSFTKVPINVVEDGIGLMTINAHKIHGQKGVGGLYIKEGIKFG